MLECAFITKPSKSASAPVHGHWRLQDCRLSHNRMPSEELTDAMIDFGWHYSQLVQRPVRATAAAQMVGGNKAEQLRPIGTKPLGSGIRDGQLYAEMQT